MTIQGNISNNKVTKDVSQDVLECTRRGLHRNSKLPSTVSDCLSFQIFICAMKRSIRKVLLDWQICLVLVSGFCCISPHTRAKICSRALPSHLGRIITTLMTLIRFVYPERTDQRWTGRTGKNERGMLEAPLCC